MAWAWFDSLPTHHQAFFVIGILVLVGGIIAVIVLAATGKFNSGSSSGGRPTVTVPVISAVIPEFEDCTTAKCFNVGNTCPFPIWIHAVNNPAAPENPVTLQPDMRKLEPGEQVQLEVPNVWSAGRVNAFYNDPTTNPLDFDKVEMTVTGDGAINYDITYVDYLALPSKITAGPGATNCNPSNPIVACNARVEDVLNGCPHGEDFDLLDPVTNRCLSAGLYCSDPNNKDKSFCHLLDSQLAKCVDPANASLYPDCENGAGNTTTNVYSCSSYFSTGPPPDTNKGNQWCAALNRNMLDNPLSVDTSLYYQGTAINQYAKWVHDTCPGIYAFAYDDFPTGAEASGDRSCTTNRLDILFCPADGSTA